MACQCGAVFSSLEALRRHRARPWYIYGLFSDAAEDDRIRYVGKTKQTPEVRFQSHLRQSIHHKTHLGSWLRKLAASRRTPDLILLETGVGHGVDEAEKWHIAFWKYSGQLVNHTAGGDGGELLDGPAGEATREKLRLAQNDPTAKAKRRAFANAQWADPVYREKLETANRTSPRVQAQLARLRADPSVERKRIEATIAANKRRATDPVYRERFRERMRTSPAVQEKLQHLNAQRRAKSKGATP